MWKIVTDFSLIFQDDSHFLMVLRNFYGEDSDDDNVVHYDKQHVRLNQNK